MIDFKNPPDGLKASVGGIYLYLRELYKHAPTTRIRVAQIQMNPDLNVEAKARLIDEQREGLVGWLDAHFKHVAVRMRESRAAIERHVAEKIAFDPLAAPGLDRASVEVARQIAAQRAEALIDRALAADPTGAQLAKLREQLAESGDTQLELAVDRVAGMRVQGTGRLLLEQAQAAVRERRLDDNSRELLAQLGEVEAAVGMLEGVRADIAKGDFVATMRSPVLLAMQHVHGSLFETEGLKEHLAVVRSALPKGAAAVAALGTAAEQ